MTTSAPSSSKMTSLSFTDDELKWLYRLATGGHAAITACLGRADRLPDDIREVLWKLATAVEERGVL